MSRKSSMILASASPRRLELLRSAGYRPKVCVSPVEEPEVRPGFIPIDVWPMLLAYIKAHHVQKHLKDARSVVVGADTIVVLDEAILGKPKSRMHARKMLTMLSGRKHQVITGLAILRGGEVRLARAISTCRIKKLSRVWLEEYLDSNRWEGKAGAYGLQDKGDPFVTLLEGEWSNVVGLPLGLLAAEIGSLGQQGR
jgi:septum formation protein